MSGKAGLDTRLYFGALSLVLLEANELEAEILMQVFSGFKVRSISRTKSTTEAQNHLDREGAQLIVVGTTPQEDGGPDEYDFIRWIRASKNETVRTAPVILLTGHTLERNVMRARDCGASFVVAKPITPLVIYDRIVWLAKDSRAFVNVASYAGPDRRFKKSGPPSGTDGRRHDDLSLKVGEAKAPNLSQSEIDAMLNGTGAIRA